jgi:hypothetical protein
VRPGAGMLKEAEKFTIQVSKTGVGVRSGAGQELHFTASEALMLLDILRNEEESLRRMAAEASPLPFRICMSGNSDKGS